MALPYRRPGQRAVWPVRGNRAPDGARRIGDSYSPCGPDGSRGTADDDCDDGDAAIYPGAEEICNGLDDDCDGYTETLVPTDEPTIQDAIDSSYVGELICVEPGTYAENIIFNGGEPRVVGMDCADQDDAIYPGSGC